MQFGKKRPLHTYIYTKTGIFFLVLLVILFGNSVYERYTIERNMAERRFDAEKEMQALIEQRELIKAKVEYISNERGIEEEIRSNFDVAKEGEQVVILVGPKNTEETPVAPIIDQNIAPWWQFWR